MLAEWILFLGFMEWVSSTLAFFVSVGEPCIVCTTSRDSFQKYFDNKGHMGRQGNTLPTRFLNISKTDREVFCLAVLMVITIYRLLPLFIVWKSSRVCEECKPNWILTMFSFVMWLDTQIRLSIIKWFQSISGIPIYLSVKPSDVRMWLVALHVNVCVIYQIEKIWLTS